MIMSSEEEKMMINQPRDWCRWLKNNWRAGVLILTPLLLIPLPVIHPNPAGRCSYVLVLMAVFWVTEALPMAITGLLPALLLPLFGIMPASKVCKIYFKDISLLLFGGISTAIAIEKWNLHKRLGLRVILAIGSEPKWLMLSFMVTSGMLSVWLANTAVTAIMLPAALAVLSELKEKRRLSKQAGTVLGSTELQTTSITKDSLTEGEENENDPLKNDIAHVKPVEEVPDEEFELFSRGLVLSVVYASNIGGTGCLTGTPPNMVMKGLLDTLFEDDSIVTFSSWFIYAFPNMVITLAFAWLWLQILFLGPRATFCRRRSDSTDGEIARKVVQREYDKLGKISFAEAAVLGHFIVLILLWITREPKFVPGWADLLTPGYVSDGCVAVAIVISLFIFPSSKPWGPQSTGSFAETRLMDWQTVQTKMSWFIYLVLGGGFSLAYACKETGLSAALGKALYGVGVLPTWFMVLMLCTFIALMTEVTSNTATATIFLPILAELALALHLNPLYLIVPATVATSFAFMLPVATGPNALAYATGRLSIQDMIKAGSVMNGVCIVVVFLSIHTWGYVIFNLGEIPTWALPLQNDIANTTINDFQNVTADYGV